MFASSRYSLATSLAVSPVTPQGTFVTCHPEFCPDLRKQVDSEPNVPDPTARGCDSRYEICARPSNLSASAMAP